MAVAKITLIGINEYLAGEGTDLFEKFQLPPEINKDVLTNYILMHAGEFPVLWANPYFVKDMIGVWSAKNLDMFKKWVFALEQEYNPIYNYDRYEETTDKESTKGTGTNKDTSSVNGYDSNTLKTNGQLDSKTEADSARDYEHKAHMYGNIGVTTATAMQTEFLELYGAWNLYDKICDMFTYEFCIMVY